MIFLSLLTTFQESNISDHQSLFKNGLGLKLNGQSQISIVQILDTQVMRVQISDTHVITCFLEETQFPFKS
jgi:hypothetical protein